MKKQAILATVSLALVALASCGKTKTSESVSDSVSESEPTLKEQWDAITNWQGGVEQDAFFAKTATIGTESAKATSRKAHFEDISGDLGKNFDMEDDWDYINQDTKQNCTLYNNDIRACSIVEVTDRTGASNKVVTTTLNQTSNAYIKEVETVDTYFNVIDDGSEVKLTPNNYYTSRAVGSGENFEDIAGFEVSTTSGAGSRLTLAYYNALDEAGKAEVKYYTNPTSTGVEYIYWAYMDFTTDGFPGHVLSIKISAKFNGNVLVSIDCDQGYYASLVSVYYSNFYYEYGYETVGDYSETVLDYTKYKVLGTLDLHYEEGDLDFETYWGYLAGSVTGQPGAPTYGRATSSTVQNYAYNRYSTSIPYVMIETIKTTSYSDGYVVSDYALQERDTDTGAAVAGSKTTQLSHDGSNIYEVVIDYDNTSYKETTPIDEDNTWEEMSDISDIVAYANMNYYKNMSGSYETGCAAYDLGDGMVELYLQQIVQQTTASFGAVIEVDIVVQIEYDTDGTTPIGLRVEESVIRMENIWTGQLGNNNYFYRAVIISQMVSAYSYDPAVSTSAAGYTTLDPDDYEEKPEETQALVRL